MEPYRSLFRNYKAQPLNTVFAHFYPIGQSNPHTAEEYDEPFRLIARNTMDGYDSWSFQQPRFQARHPYTAVPKLRNYLNYTFVRLVDLQNANHSSVGQYFRESADQDWICFNTGLQNPHGADLLAAFQRYAPKAGAPSKIVPDYVYKGCYTPSERMYRDHFGTDVPELAWYSRAATDYVFDTGYHLDRDAFDHLFERAKERAGLENVNDEVVRNYLRGALENLVPKIRRNYKVAIPVYYVEEKRMQMLLPFAAANNSNDYSAFLVERDDTARSYKLKTVFDLDQAYFSARLITRPDRDWLNP